MKLEQLSVGLGLGLASLASGALLNGCSQTQSGNQQPVIVNGSSTVYPITEAIAAEFRQVNPEGISVDFSSTGSGFEKFCQGKTAINDASRPINSREMAACKKAKVAYIELPIAYDALTVVVNTQNNWAQEVTLAELKRMWQPQSEGKITRWRQVRSSWPGRPLNLFGPDEKSGTFDYFTEAIVGQDGASRQDYVYSEDDVALVKGVSQDPNALGYFGLAYYKQHQDKLQAVAIDNGSGAVLPTEENVKQAAYQPLSRPLFIYVNAQAAQNNPVLEEFVEFYLLKAPELVEQVGYIPLPEEVYQLASIHFQRGKVGTVFAGQAQINLTIGQLLRQQATF